MAIRAIAKQFTIVEQTIWVLIGLALFYVEGTAIYIDRSEQDAIHHRELLAQQTAFDELISDTRKHFDEVSKHEQGILLKTQQIQSLAKRNLEDLTGGNSFPYAFPLGGSNAAGFFMELRNTGQQPLSLVTMAVGRVYETCDQPMCAKSVDKRIFKKLLEGTVAPKGRLPTDLYLDSFTDDKGVDRPGVAHFLFFISAQNGVSNEDLWIRPAKDGIRSDYRIAVTHLGNDGRPRLVMDPGWVEAGKAH